MKLFTVDENKRMVQFSEKDFEKEHNEVELEDLLENNPEYFFENSDILIIGRQVVTNLNSYIDLLGLDKNGNTVAIELKREKTPRETVAQLLEYASFVENLDYNNLNKIFQDYSSAESELDYYHKQYFNIGPEDKIAFNKSTKMIIVAQEVSKDIKQTALYLRKKGIEIYCIEFKLFETKSSDKIISSDIIIGEEDFIKGKIKSSPLPKIDKKKFFDSLDKNGVDMFGRIFKFAQDNDLMFRWGAKGFSLNVTFDEEFVGLIFGYPPQSVFKQSIYTGFEEIDKKVNDSESIIEIYKKRIKEFGHFVKGGLNYKWIINESIPEKTTDTFLLILKDIIKLIKQHGLKE